jgi:hypothetical protein
MPARKTKVPESTVTHGGETLTVNEWANRLGIESSALHQRLYRMAPERALSMKPGIGPHLVTYNGVTRPVSDWARYLGIGRTTMWKRLHRFPLDVAMTMPRRSSSKPVVEHEGSLVDGRRRFADDQHAVSAVLCKPDGMEHHEIGDLVGVGRERIRQIEEAALRKLRVGMRLIDLLGVDKAESILNELTGMPVWKYEQRLARVRMREMDAHG